jgi:hypothetical protein
MNSTEACIALNMLPTMGPVRLRKLLEVFGTPEDVLAAKRDSLRKVEGIGNEVADQISGWESIVDLDAELARIRDFGATVITQALISMLSSPGSATSERRLSRSSPRLIPSRSGKFIRLRSFYTCGGRSSLATIMPLASSVPDGLLIMGWSQRRN